jgi:hypothetical protein
MTRCDTAPGPPVGERALCYLRGQLGNPEFTALSFKDRSACSWTPSGPSESSASFGAACAWIAQHRNLLLIGPAGIDKSWLGETFAERACRSGYSAYCARASRLFHRTLHVVRNLPKRPACVLDFGPLVGRNPLA